MLSQNGKFVVGAGLKGEILLWTNKGQSISKNNLGTVPIKSVFIDKEFIVSGRNDGKVILCDINNNTMRDYIGHSDCVNCVKIHSVFIFSCGADNDCTIRKWDLFSNKCLDIIVGHTQGINSIVLYLDFVISAGKDKIVRIDKVLSSDKIGDWIECLEFSDNGAKVVLGYKQGLVREWENGNIVSEWNLESRVMSLALYKKNTAAGCMDMNIYIKTKKNITKLVGHGDSILSLAFLNSFLLSGSCDGLVKIWLWKEKICMNSLNLHGGYVHRVLVNAKYAVCTSGCSDNKITIWDLENDSSDSFYHHRGRVKALALFTNIFATGGSDNIIQIWSYDGLLINSLISHTEPVTDLCFYLCYLVSSSEDKWIFVWDWTNSQIVAKCFGVVAWKIFINEKNFFVCENKGSFFEYFKCEIVQERIEYKLVWRTNSMIECKNCRFNNVCGVNKDQSDQLLELFNYIN